MLNQNNRLENLLYSDALEVYNSINLKELDNKKILITGCSGLIGLNIIALLKLLQSKNYNIDITSTVFNKPEDYLLNMKSNKFKIIQFDLSDTDKCKSELDDNYDMIIHCATYGQPNLFLENKLKTITLNTTITDLLLKKLKKDGKFLFISSSEIYSGSMNQPHNESDIGTTTPQHSRSAYIESKRCAEAICQAYIENGYNVKIARLCLAYGIGTKPNDKRVLNNFIQKALVDKEIRLMDSGNSLRNYGYTSDIIEIFFNILLNGKEIVYNVTGQNIISIKDLALKIGNILNVPIIIPEENHGMIGAPNKVILDISKVKNEFNKNKFVSLNDGLKRTIEWQKLLY